MHETTLLLMQAATSSSLITTRTCRANTFFWAHFMLWQKMSFSPWHYHVFSFIPYNKLQGTWNVCFELNALWCACPRLVCIDQSTRQVSVCFTVQAYANQLRKRRHKSGTHRYEVPLCCAIHCTGCRNVTAGIQFNHETRSWPFPVLKQI